MEAVAFYLFSALTIAMFLIVVLSKNALYAMSALAGGMIFIAGFFFLLDAEFLGVVQIIVYTGAVMALYAFGMMFFDTTRDVKEKIENKTVLYVLIGFAVVFAVIAISAPLAVHNFDAVAPMVLSEANMHIYSLNGIPEKFITGNAGNAEMVGLALFTKYLVPFELAAIMLLVAMVAGIVLVSKKMDINITLLETEALHEAEEVYDKKKEEEQKW